MNEVNVRAAREVLAETKRVQLRLAFFFIPISLLASIFWNERRGASGPTVHLIARLHMRWHCTGLCYCSNLACILRESRMEIVIPENPGFCIENWPGYQSD